MSHSLNSTIITRRFGSVNPTVEYRVRLSQIWPREWLIPDKRYRTSDLGSVRGDGGRDVDVVR